MHRTWVYQVKELVKEGENLLELHIASPVKFIEAYKPEKGREIHLTNTGTTPGSQYIRKAHSMFGWDWGPQLPDTGIWRPVELCAFSGARIARTSSQPSPPSTAPSSTVAMPVVEYPWQMMK